MLSEFFNRQIGDAPASSWQRKEEMRRTYSLTLAQKKDIVSGHSKAVLCMNIDPTECRYLLTTGIDANICLYDMSKTYNTGAQKFNTLATINTATHERAHKKPVTCVQWYPFDTGAFFSGGFDGRVLMWDTNLLEVAHSFYLGGSIVTSIDQSHIATAHSLVAAAVAEPNVHLCDVRAARAAQVLLGHKDSVTVVRWSPTDEHALVSGSLDGTVRMWDVRRPGWLMMYDMHLHYKDKSRSTGFHFVEKKARVARAHEGGVIGLQFTPDGRYLVTTGTENIMRLWETDTGVNTLVNYPGAKYRQGSPFINRIAISSNGQLIYHPSGQNIGVYELQTGKKIHSLRGHFDNVMCCEFHPELQELYSGAADASMLVWSPAMDELGITQEVDDMSESADWQSDGEDDLDPF